MTPTTSFSDAIEHDAPSDDRPIAAVAAFPQVVGQDRDLRGAGLFLRRQKVPPEHRIDAEQRQKVRGNWRDVDALGLATVTAAERARRTNDLRPGSGGERLEEAAPLLVVAEVTRRDGGQRLVADAEIDPDVRQPTGIAVWQRLHQNTMDDAEDCCRGADAEGERDNRNGREARRARQRPESVFQVLNHGCPVRRA